MGEAPKSELDRLLGEFDAESRVDDALARLSETLAVSPEVTSAPDRVVEVVSVPTPAIESAALHGRVELPVLRVEVPAKTVSPVVSESAAPVLESAASPVSGANVMERRRGRNTLKAKKARGAKPVAAQVPATKAADSSSQTASADVTPVAAAPEAVVFPPAPPVLTEVVPDATSPTASVEQEPTPFLAEEGKIYRFSGNSGVSKDMRLIRKGDAYYFLNEQGEPYLGWDHGSAEEFIRELALREHWQSVLPEQEGAMDVPSEDAPTVPAELDEAAAQESKEQTAWTKERLLALVADGGEFTLQSSMPGGNSVKYVRKAEKFLRKMDDSGRDASTIIVRRLGNGDYIFIPTLNDRVPLNELPAPEHTFEKKGRYAFLSLGAGEHLAFQDSTGHMGVITVERKADGMYRLFGESGTPLPTTIDAAALRTIADEESWELLDQVDASRENTKGQGMYGFFELNAGDKLSYVNEHGERRAVERLTDDSYRVLDGDGVPLGAPYDERYLLRMAEQEHWQLVENSEPVPALDEEAVPPLTAEQERDAKRDSFLKMRVGDRLTFVGTGGAVTVELVAVGRYALYDAGGEIIHDDFDELYILNIAEAEGWFGEVVKNTDLPEVVDTPEAGEAMSEIERLELMVSEARLEFVTIDYKQNSNWQKIRKVIGRFLSDVPNDRETEEARLRYERALTNLQEAQLAALKDEPLAGLERRERMAGMLRYYQYDERIKLISTRDEVKLEDVASQFEKSKVVEILKGVEKMGRWYNKLERRQKFFIAAACGGAAIGAAVTGGAAVGAAATGLAFVRKVVTTAGLGVGLDAFLKTREEKSESDMVEEDIKGVLERVEEDYTNVEERLEGLKQFLQTDVARLNNRFQDQKGKDVRRRVLAWGGAFGGSFGLPYAWETWKEFFPASPDVSTENLTRPLRAPGLAEAASAPEVAASAPHAVASAPAQGVTVPAGTEALPSSPHAPTNALLSTYEVTEADGKRGLWGALERRLPSDVAAADRPRVVANLLKALQDKVDDMSPEDRVAAGLDANGNLDKIRPGTTIAFEKLLTPKEIEMALSGESVAKVARGAAEIADSVADGSAGDALSQDSLNQAVADSVKDTGVDGTPSDTTAAVEAAIAEDRARMPAQTVSFDTAPPVRSMMPNVETVLGEQGFSDPARLAAYMAEHPELQKSYAHTLGGMRTAIFSLPQDMTKLPYIEQIEGGFNPLSQGPANMERVLEAYHDMKTGRINPFEYDRSPFPFKSSQVERLVHLVSVASHPKVFGELGQPFYRETVAQYMERMAALAAATHNERILVTRLFRINA